MSELLNHADALLARLKDQERARLRIYIGAAPGVGKTYSMLQEAHALRARGLDVVAEGLIAFAQREGITHVIFGQSARSRWELLWRASTIERFLSSVRDAAVQVVPLHEQRA
jgi:K+-sensing histidine kinase KdpD